MAVCNATRAYDTCTCPATAGGGGGAAGTVAPVGGNGGTTPPTGGAGAGGGSAAGAGGGAAGSGGMPSGANSWLQMGYDERNWYFNPAETTISVANAPMLEEKWRFTIVGYPPGSPVIVDGKVFVMATGGTYAIDLASGTELWKRLDIQGTASAAFRDGFLYVHAGPSAELYKLNAADGTTVWGPEKTYNLQDCDGTSSPILGGGLVIVGHSCGLLEIGMGAGDQNAARGGVEAHSMETGEKEWTYFTVPESGENGAMVWSSVGIDEAAGTVYAATGNNYTMTGPNSDSIHALDLAAGTKKWMKQVRAGDLWSIPVQLLTNLDTDFGANPIIFDHGGMQIVADGDKGHAFWALDRTTGDILWSRDDLSTSRNMANGGVLMNGAFDGTRIYVTSNQPPNVSVLHALDPANGADLWTPKTFNKTNWGALSVANGVLVVPMDDDIYFLNASTGEELRMFNTGGTIAAGAAAIAQGRVVVKSGMQYPLDPTAKPNDQIICYGLP